MKIIEALKMPRAKVSQTLDEQASYWRAKRTEIETGCLAEKQKISDLIESMNDSIKILTGVPKTKYVLKKLGLYGDPKYSPFSFEFPS